MTEATTEAGLATPLPSLAERYRQVRQWTEQLCSPLATEDYVIQSMPDASPTRWHLAHTTWFFETFVLKPFVPDYEPYHPLYEFLFNSYYNAVGAQYPRPERGLLSRPTVSEVYQYRSHVDHALLDYIETATPEQLARLEETLVLGFNHEQQHQELLLTDLKHMLSHNPLETVYTPAPPHRRANIVPELRWVSIPGGVYTVGHEGGGFSFDSEGPRHQTLLQDARIASRLVTNGEYLEFMGDGAYQRSDLWLSDGWRTVARAGLVRAPLLGGARRSVVAVHPAWHAPRRPRRARLPREPLRGRRLRPLGRRASPHGGGMGGGGILAFHPRQLCRVARLPS